MINNNALIVFNGKGIRRIWYDEEWYFSVIDIVEVLTDSSSPRQYWGVLKSRDSQLLTICLQLKLESKDGKKYLTDCVNTENAFRLIQSIPSKKAEPFKKWLARVGYERVQEIENPELAQERMKEIYKEKGYSNYWIEKRVRGIAIRNELTDEWQKRGIEDKQDFAILTNEITKAAFNKTINEYKEFKGLDKQNLRDHMTDIELVLTMLGEVSTTSFTKNRDSQEFKELQKDAKDGGSIAKVARKEFEKKQGKSALSSENYLKEPEKNKRLKEN